jgi:hypothetical protein
MSSPAADSESSSVLAVPRTQAKQRRETTTVSRQEATTDTEPKTEANEDAGEPEPSTPPIDEDVAGSVNAALHDADDD